MPPSTADRDVCRHGTRVFLIFQIRSYRWRDWAAQSDGITGDELLALINNEETTLPNGKRNQGLFRYLRTLTSSNGDDRRDVIATVFKGVQNRMVSGYLLRDVINKLNGIHFTSSGELHTLGALYESMLREMRDAAGDSGEFCTPRAVVRFRVTVTNPRLGETVLDPASGIGGFLVEAFKHRRCLIPADSFYEWQEREGKRQTFRVMLKSAEPFCFAGLWEKWIKPPSRDHADTDLDKAPPSETIESFTIITRAANAAIAPLHDRMPVIIAPSHYGWWLKDDDPRSESHKLALERAPDDPLKIYPVSDLVNSPKTDDPRCIEPVRIDRDMFERQWWGDG